MAVAAAKRSRILQAFARTLEARIFQDFNSKVLEAFNEFYDARVSQRERELVALIIDKLGYDHCPFSTVSRLQFNSQDGCLSFPLGTTCYIPEGFLSEWTDSDDFRALAFEIKLRFKELNKQRDELDEFIGKCPSVKYLIEKLPMIATLDLGTDLFAPVKPPKSDKMFSDYDRLLRTLERYWGMREELTQGVSADADEN